MELGGLKSQKENIVTEKNVKGFGCPSRTTHNSIARDVRLFSNQNRKQAGWSLSGDGASLQEKIRGREGEIVKTVFSRES